MNKNVIVIQHDLRDCGPACLQSVIKHYGGYVPIEKIRIDANTTIEGTTAYNLIKTAKKYGFDAYGARIENKELNNSLIVPFIAQVHINNLSHFVVVYEIKKDKVILMDPSCGKKIMKIEEFKSIWTNFIINFYPQNKILKYDNKNTLFTLIKIIIHKNKNSFKKIIITSIFLTIVSILCNLYFKAVIDSISAGYDISKIKYIIFVFLIFNISKILFMYYKEYYENYLNKNIDVTLIMDFIKHIFYLPLNMVKSRKVGEITTRVTELYNIKALFSEIFVSIFLNSILTFISMIILYRINKQLFLILFLVVIIYSIIGIIINKYLYRRIVNNIEYETDFNSQLIENVNVLDSIKNLNIIDDSLFKIEIKLVKFLKDNFDLNKIMNIQNILKNSILELGIFTLNTVGFYLIIKNELTVINLITFNSLLLYFFEPIKSCVEIIPKYNYLKATIDKINEFICLKEEDLKETNEFINGDIVFNNIDYSYNDFNYILKNKNMLIEKNKHVCLWGKSGSGKSTLCKLLYRLMDMNKGNILIGKVSIQEYTLNTIRDNITYVSQNEKLIDDTIMNNIVLNREISVEKISEICKICRIEEIIKNKRLGMYSCLDSDSTNISGGERQRIILARALLKNSSIIILDEALSEVDYNLESKIIKDIRDYFHDKTILYVTHKDHRNLFDKVINFEVLNERVC